MVFLFNSGTRSLCVQYMKFQAARQIPWRQSETRHVDCRFPPPILLICTLNVPSGGTLNTHYRMLLFHGFDESNDQLKCPLNLKISLRTCIKSHARLLPNLKNRGLFPNDVLSEPISWGSSCQLQKKLHGVSIRENIDFGCNMFTLQLTQGLYRQQLCGQTSFPCLAASTDGDMVVVNVAGGKADQEGLYSYGKRFACNSREAHNCFPTALARHIFSRQSNDSSMYLYMTDQQAIAYERKKADLDARNEGLSEPIRVRSGGPHTKFRRHFTRFIFRMDAGSPNIFGVHKNTITLHSLKRVGYRHARRCPSIRQEHLSARAGDLFHIVSISITDFEQIIVREIRSRMDQGLPKAWLLLEGRMNGQTVLSQNSWPIFNTTLRVSTEFLPISLPNMLGRFRFIIFVLAISICLIMFAKCYLFFWHNLCIITTRTQVLRVSDTAILCFFLIYGTVQTGYYFDMSCIQICGVAFMETQN
jgi:hypothetical protein